AARADLQAGDLPKAEAACDRGLSSATSRGDRLREWRFRLLRAGILLNSQRAEMVLNQLAQPIPTGPEFAPLAARKKMLEGQAHSILHHIDKYERLLDEAHRDAEATNAQDVLVEIEVIRGSTLIFRERFP